MENNELIISDCSTNILNDISLLFTKYDNNPYILNRLQVYLTNLPNLLENENKKYEERLNRIQELTLEQEQFYKIFLSKHKYYYMPYNNLYYLYDDKTYKIISEDEILYNLLSTITDENKLIVWKHKTKQTLIKKIKERNLLKSTPETYTIQNILNFLNTFFNTKTETKYFLTVLGDCIFKKNSKELLFFVDTNTRKIINLIDSISYITTGNSITNKFISKYHDSHNLTNYRLIHTNDNYIINDLNKELLDKIGLDLLCVACHYSDRYNNSDNYLITKVEEYIKQKILFFTYNSLDTIINDFIYQSTETANENYQLSWKNIHYIWKIYLTNNSIPNMIYSNNLKKILMSKLQYIEEKTDIIFINITSKFLPNISNFLTFWEKHIIIPNNSNSELIFQFENNSDYLFQYEVDEIIALYKLHNENNNINCYVNEKDIVKIISHFFYPSVKIIEQKYIINITCNLWNKHEDVKNILNDIILIVHDMENYNDQLLSFDELYELYKKLIHKKIIIENKNLLVVSKYYFEKCIEYYWSDYIKFDKFVSIN
jgi:hypothetical protein